MKEDYLSRKQWRKVQYLTDLFWKRWILEYLPNLQERQKWFRIRRNVQAGDLVIFRESGLTRNKWSLGQVTEVFADATEEYDLPKLKQLVQNFIAR